MAIKPRLMALRHWALMFCLLSLPPRSALYAQGGDHSGENFFIETSTRFVQRLTWTEGLYATGYEVLIEQEEGGVYTVVLRESTENTFIQVSLEPGAYRYQVIPLDIFGRPGEASRWMPFVVRNAFAPEIYSFSPAVFGVLPWQNEYILEIDAVNLEQGAQIRLLSRVDGEEIEPARTVISPDGASARLHFNARQLEYGVFIIHARNPSGLEASLGLFTVEEIEVEDGIVFELFCALGWPPLFYLHGDLDMPAGTLLHLDGAALRFGALTANYKLLNIGFELTASWYTFADETVRSFLLENNILVRWQLDRNSPFNIMLRLGAGFIFPSNEENKGDLLNVNAIFANAGLSFLWVPSDTVFIEAGANYSYLFALDNYSGFLRPFIAVGYKPGRRIGL